MADLTFEPGSMSRKGREASECSGRNVRRNVYNQTGAGVLAKIL